jgi:acyl carrier protein phosphodiesterase
MNYLAHCYLSGNNSELLLGNFIADHVKGSQINNFSPTIKDGIKLHRLIDEFTDSHPVVLESKIRLRDQFHKYSPVIVDVYYDHFLAKNWNHYHHLQLSHYSKNVYSLIRSYGDIIPERTIKMLNHMEAHDWLRGYAEIEGIKKALTGLARRTTFESGMESGDLVLIKFYKEFEIEFNNFFADLRLFVANISIT